MPVPLGAAMRSATKIDKVLAAQLYIRSKAGVACATAALPSERWHWENARTDGR